MARRLHDDDERARRIELVGDIFLKTGYSTRTLSRLISNDIEHGFKISNATVSTYINEYKAKHHDKSEQIEYLISINNGSSVEDPNVVKRVYNVAKRIIDGETIDDIARKLGESYWVIYYDINLRLSQIDPKLYAEVKQTFDNHS